MFRKHSSVLLTVLCVAVVATAQEKEAKDFEAWGTLIDPAGGATAVRKNEALELTVPGQYRDMWPGSCVNAPRILRPVKGDFSVQVKVTSAVNVTGKSLAPDVPAKARWVVQAASLIIWHDENNFVRLERNSGRNSGLSEPTKHVWYYNAFDGGTRVVHRRGDVRADGTSQLWIARKQGTFYAYYRQEGDANWTALEVHRLGLPDEVQVGVSLVNTTNEPFTVRFEDLRVGDVK